MDKKRLNTWMTVISLILGIDGLVFILISIFNSSAGTWALMIGLLSIALGNILNVFHMQYRRKFEEG